MASTTVGTESARENPGHSFAHARALYEMALADMADAEPDFETDCVMDLYCLSMTEAADTLVMLPAPDMAAITYKLEVIRNEEVDRRADFRDVLNALIADVQRLAGGARHGN